MPANRKILLLEANEIPFTIIDRYVAEKPRSHLARLLPACKQHRTICEDQVELDPWISWPTLHRGVIDEQHQIFHLGQSLEEANRRYPPIWELLATQGVNVGVMGSLHSSAPPADVSRYAFYVPDFFAESTFAHPPILSAFQAFNLVMTRRSARNVDGGMALREALQFLLRYPLQGLSLSTVSLILQALFAELNQPHLKCRRRSLQPLITLDVFLHCMEKALPSFATLHANHVAAAMHRYWTAAYPQDIADNPMPEEWQKKYGQEIAYSMDAFDLMVGRLSAFVTKHSDYKLLIASSLGQAPVRAHPTKGFVTITDVAAFMERLGVARSEWTQRFAMVPCVSVLVEPGKADDFERKLRQISVAEHSMQATKRELPPLSYDRTDNSFQLYFYFERYEGTWQARLGNVTCSFQELGLGFHEHQDEIACAARHTPDGILLVYDPIQPAVDATRSCISTLTIAPALLDAFGIVPPSYMHASDPAILDTATSGTRAGMQVLGGGIEKPVKRGDARSMASSAAGG